LESIQLLERPSGVFIFIRKVIGQYFAGRGECRFLEEFVVELRVVEISS
jgi:hypothetical protein